MNVSKMDYPPTDSIPAGAVPNRNPPYTVKQTSTRTFRLGARGIRRRHEDVLSGFVAGQSVRSGIVKAITRFETIMESLVERGFARLLRTRMQPIEVAKKLSREMETQRTVAINRILVPNS